MENIFLFISVVLAVVNLPKFRERGSNGRFQCPDLPRYNAGTLPLPALLSVRIAYQIFFACISSRLSGSLLKYT